MEKERESKDVLSVKRTVSDSVQEEVDEPALNLVEGLELRNRDKATFEGIERRNHQPSPFFFFSKDSHHNSFSAALNFDFSRG